LWQHCVLFMRKTLETRFTDLRDDVKELERFKCLVE